MSQKNVKIAVRAPSMEPPDAARGEFDREISPLRSELHAHCYRMLGSVHDADDALQEGLLRAWRSFERFEGRSSLRTWLYTIVTRTCLDAISARGRRSLPIDLGPATQHPVAGTTSREEIPWLTPYPDPEDAAEHADDVTLAFVATLQHLSGNERAAFLLVDVLGFPAADAAIAMVTTPTSIHSALARARRALSTVARTGEPTGSRLPSETMALARDFAEALKSSDLEAFTALLAPDVTWQMPPFTEWYRGIRAVSAFAHAVPMTSCPSWRTTVLTANGAPAVAFYLADSEDAPHLAWSITVLEVHDATITAITSFLDPEVFERFGLPHTIG